MLDLAQTAWPRFGGDRANRSLASVPGPHTNPTWVKISLPAFDSMYSPGSIDSSAIVMPDETLRVFHAGRLLAVTLWGTILWQLELSGPRSGGLYEESFSLPMALQSGETLLYAPGTLVLVDQAGNMSKQKHKVKTLWGSEAVFVRPFLCDKSSPNLTYNGLALLPTVSGELYIFYPDRLQKLGNFGYDIPMPAVYPDNSLAIAGYYGAGFCRVNLDGSFQWGTKLSGADLPPVLNFEYVAAVGALNDACSAFFSPDGGQIGSYPYPARFAVFPDGGWIALSEQRLARLTLEGQEVWAREIERGKYRASFVEQPLVDSDGFTFLHLPDGFRCYDPRGYTAFEMYWPGCSPGLLSIVAPGVIACVVENELMLGFA